MSITILALAKSFLSERLTADEFVNAYMELWKFERDNNLLALDSDSLSESLSSIFCLADLYNPDCDREDYELDEVELRTRIMVLLSKS